MSTSQIKSFVGGNADSLAVLEPLSGATRIALRPASLDRDDRIVLFLNTEGTEFEIVLFQETATPSDSYIKAQGKIHYMKKWMTVSIDASKSIDRMPEVRTDTHNYKRYAAATDFTVLSIAHTWPRENIYFGDDLTEQTYTYLLLRFMAQSSRAKMAAEFKINGSVPEKPADWVDHPDLPLAPYQRVASMFALKSEGTAFFMDRGTGKTPTVIQTLCVEARENFKRTGKMYRALIICPQQVRTNWQRELNRFATVKGRATVIRGGQLERIRLLAHSQSSKSGSAFTAVIASYDSAAIMISQMKMIPWDLIVLDESHFIKSSATKRWKSIIQLRDCSKKRIILTGTPIGNSIMDLWAQLEFLGQGLSGFKSFKEFRAFHGIYEPTGTGIERLAGVKNIALIQERLARVSFAVSKAEAGLNLPDKVYDIHEVEMTEEQATWYQNIADALTLEIESKLDGESPDSVTIESILTSLLRLAQITSGFITTDAIVDSSDGTVIKPKQIRRITGENPKINAVVEMLTAEDRDPNGKTVIWCHFVEDIRHITEVLTRLGIEHGTYYGATSERDRETNVRRFNSDPTFRVLVCNPQTAGEGLNLLGYDPSNPTQDTYCDHEIFFSQNWSAILRAQAEDRAHRRGTRMPVRITDLMVPGTIDEEIRKRVQMKQRSADAALDLREILANVLSFGK